MNQFWRPNSVKNSLSESACGWAAGLRRLEGLQESEAHPVVMHRCKQDRPQHFTVIIFFAGLTRERSLEALIQANLYPYFITMWFSAQWNQEHPKVWRPAPGFSCGSLQRSWSSTTCLGNHEVGCMGGGQACVFPYKSTTQGRCRIEIYRCYKNMQSTESLKLCWRIIKHSSFFWEPRWTKMF